MENTKQLLNIEWQKFQELSSKKVNRKLKKTKLPKYDENAIMMHWSNNA